MGQLFYKEIKSIIGKLKLIAKENVLVAILWEWENPDRVKLGPLIKSEDHPILLETEKQLQDYFEGRRKKFSLPVLPCGTSFQRKVWEALQQVPYGSTLSYSELAKQIGKPHSARAVGAALGKNPIGIIIPCHRIIGKNGKLVGFAAGLESKEILLNREKSFLE